MFLMLALGGFTTLTFSSFTENLILRHTYVLGILVLMLVALVSTLIEFKILVLTTVSLLYLVSVIGLILELCDVPPCITRSWYPFMYVDTNTCSTTPHSVLSPSIPQILAVLALHRTYKLLVSKLGKTTKNIHADSTRHETCNNSTGEIVYLGSFKKHDDVA